MKFKVIFECDHCREEIEHVFVDNIPKIKLSCDKCGTEITNKDIVDTKKVY